jgi:hypothetical protein
MKTKTVFIGLLLFSFFLVPQEVLGNADWACWRTKPVIIQYLGARRVDGDCKKLYSKTYEYENYSSGGATHAGVCSGAEMAFSYGSHDNKTYQGGWIRANNESFYYGIGGNKAIYEQDKIFRIAKEVMEYHNLSQGSVMIQPDYLAVVVGNQYYLKFTGDWPKTLAEVNQRFGITAPWTQALPAKVSGWGGRQTTSFVYTLTEINALINKKWDPYQWSSYDRYFQTNGCFLGDKYIGVDREGRINCAKNRNTTYYQDHDFPMSTTKIDFISQYNALKNKYNEVISLRNEVLACKDNTDCGALGKYDGTLFKIFFKNIKYVIDDPNLKMIYIWDQKILPYKTFPWLKILPGYLSKQGFFYEWSGSSLGKILLDNYITENYKSFFLDSIDADMDFEIPQTFTFANVKKLLDLENEYSLDLNKDIKLQTNPLRRILFYHVKSQLDGYRVLMNFVPESFYDKELTQSDLNEIEKQGVMIYGEESCN